MRDVTNPTPGVRIQDAFDPIALASLVEDIPGDLAGSLAIFEQDGEHVFDAATGWCRFLRESSGSAGDGGSVGAARPARRWPCQETCWSAAREAMRTASGSVRTCPGGFRVQAFPIEAGDVVAGAIALGFGVEPPPAEVVRKVAEALGVPFEAAAEVARAHVSPAPQAVETAIARLRAAARFMGETVRRASTEGALELLRTLVEQSADAIYRLSLDGTILSWNPAAEKVYDALADEAIGSCFARFVPDGRVAEFRSFLGRIEKGDAVPAIATERVRADGRRIDVVVSMSPARNRAGRVVGAIVVARDETALRQGESALRESEQRFRRVIDSNLTGVLVSDACGRIHEANDAFLETVGYSRDDLVEGRLRWDTLTPPEFRHLDERAHANLVATGVCKPWEKECVRKDGRRVPVLVGCVVLKRESSVPECLAIVVDQTQLREAQAEKARVEEQLRQAQKLEAIGRLAGGIAHDFNNLMTVVTGYGALALEKLDPQDPLHKEVAQMTRAGERAGSLTRQLLAFSRKRVVATKVVSLRSSVADVVPMLRRVLGEQVELTVESDPEPGNVRVDPTQIDQVILNLVINARDAIPSHGRVSLETRNVQLHERDVRGHAGAVPGPYVVLAVSDTGTGMDAETLAHIFEPFFTTKEADRGTGLGLSTVYGIVKQSGGHVAVESLPGHGTTFRVYLPRVQEQPTPHSPTVLPTSREGGSETILVVEDDDLVSSFASTILAGHGYKVLVSGSGDAALALAQSTSGPIHLVLMDVVLPRGNGREAWERLRLERPAARVLYMSGYAEDVAHERAGFDAPVAFIQKPFTPSGLLRKVRDVLDGRGEAP